ncbi:MAG: Type 1 glutamine amidotransferase-like domain-containing protein [Alphaproteobacteria bacterium]
MTRVLLHGGYPGFFEGATADTAMFTRLAEAAQATDGKILLHFAGYDHKPEFIEAFEKNLHAHAPKVKRVLTQETTLPEQLAAHKVIFLQGGARLKQWELFEGVSKNVFKQAALVAGSSAGAMLLCRYGHSSKFGVKQGVGLVEVSVIVHANARPADDYIMALQSQCAAPVLVLNELQMVEVAV